MKKILSFLLCLILVISLTAFNSRKPNISHCKALNSKFADPIWGCFESGGVWYTVYGKYPSENIITRIAWGNTYLPAYPNPSLGSFYVNSNGILCISTITFNGQNGPVTYDGRLYVCQ